jgi:hypothetical protein
MREDALGAFFFAVNREGDPLIEEDQVTLLLGSLELRRRGILEHFKERSVMGPDGATGIEHLIEGTGQLIFFERGTEL